MSGISPLVGLALAGLLLAPGGARAGDIRSYRDADGVVHFVSRPHARSHASRPTGRAGQPPRPAAQARARPVAMASAPSRAEREALWREHIRRAAERYNLPEPFLRAVMAVESNFDHLALSSKGAVGLMQLMPATASEMYVEDAWDPYQNIEGGARYLRILANQYQGDVPKTLAAYNAGPDAVRRAGGVPNIPETREYVRRVTELYAVYRAGK
jgi:soluble lytic murein transglycosylase-like protein